MEKWVGVDWVDRVELDYADWPEVGLRCLDFGGLSCCLRGLMSLSDWRERLKMTFYK